jgi:hypothetical protein
MMTSQAHTRIGAAAAAFAFSLACSEPEQPASVTVAPVTVTIDALGDTKQLAATALDKDGKILTDVIFTWASSAAGVASVDSSGKVTSVASGTSDVTATAGGVSGTSKITVAQGISHVEATSGAQQTGTVGQQLPQPIVVRVGDRLNSPVVGAAVTFTVQANGGAVTPPSGTTGADGQLTATWTLGTTSGNFQVTAAVTGTASSALFNAKANPGAANNLAKVSGDNQFGYQGVRLAQPVTVRVRDQYGNGVPSHAVQFTTSAGNGTADSSIAFSDSTGVARSGWVMPSTGIVDTVSLAVSSLSGGGSPLLGSPAAFTAVAHNVRVTGWSPGTLAEGQAATLTGTGFDGGNTQNVVTIDGVATAVTAATGTDLSVTVPAYDCRPARHVAVQVTVGGIPAAPATIPLSPAVPALNLSVGQQTIVTNPAQFCFQLAAADTRETYLVGVQSTSEVPADLTPVSLVGTAVAGATAAPALSLRPVPTARTLSPQTVEQLQRWRRYRAAEIRQRADDREVFARLAALGPARAPGATRAVVDSTVTVGANLTIRVGTGGGCANYVEINTVVRANGAKGIFLEDLANPTGGYAASQFATFSSQYDAKTYSANEAEFGTPTDSDGNGRIVVVVTKEVNKRDGPLGFTTSCDLGTRATSPASNEGEFFYIAAPDPNGTVSGAYSAESATSDFPVVVAHESVHVIQFGRRKAAGATPFLDVWTSEGQAVLGEEVVGHAVLGNATGANYGLDKIIVSSDGSSSLWYDAWVIGLGLYFGWDPISVPGQSGRVANAPWECTWLASDYGGPCVGGLDPYGTTWSLLRYVSDRFGPTYTGGEGGLQRDIIEHAETGFAMLESVIGVRADTLLAQWAATLYVDDFPLPSGTWASLAPTLSLSSWNLDGVFYGEAFGRVLVSELRLTPDAFPYQTFSKSANVRAASTYYAILFGDTRLPIAVKARDASGNGQLPSHMRYWIVRIQ